MGNAKYILIGASTIIIVVLVAFAAKTIIAGPSTGQTYSTISQDSQALAKQAGGGMASTTGTAIPSGNIQQANLALIDFSYKLTPNKLVKGVPVKITVDASTLSGCMTTVVIKDFGVIKRITAKDNIIEFTPDKTGVFWITCGMGMGPGSFEVVNPDGTSNPTTTQTLTPPRPSGGTCGGSGAGGGCGCGG